MDNTALYDVIIVGAGMAGLAAAHELRRNLGITVLVLEAQNYIGGRVKTDFDWGEPVELGAEFVHGKGTIIGKLTEELHLDMREAFSGHTLINRDGEKLSDELQKEYESLIDYVFENGKVGISVDKIIRNSSITVNEDVIELACHFFEDFEAASAKDIDSGALTQAYERTKFFGGEIVFRNGYSDIVDYFVERVTVHLNSPVNKIDWSNSQVVTLYCSNNVTYRARKIIITASLGVLKADRIAFMPRLPDDKQRIISALGMGNACKVLVLLRSAETARRIFRISNADSESLQLVTNWWGSASNERVLVGYVGGARAAHILSLSQEQLRTVVTNDLIKVFGTDFAQEIIDIKLSRWDDNPYIAGAYSYHPVGIENRDRTALAKPCGNIFWAGEATQIDGTYAMVHGAVASGYRAAKEVVGSLKTMT